MPKLNDRDRNILRLILRSPDIGDGWRQVSKVVWPLVDSFEAEGLIEKDHDLLRVRLTPDGAAVAEYT